VTPKHPHHSQTLTNTHAQQLHQATSSSLWSPSYRVTVIAPNSP